MAATSNEMTREGYEALTRELEYLSVEKRQEISERLKEAISYGDISENSEYDAAKEAQAENEDRIKEIEAILRTAKVVEDIVEESEAGTVQTGRTVTVKDLVYDEVMTYKIVGNTEANLTVPVVGERTDGLKERVGHILFELEVPALPHRASFFC